MKGPLDLTLSAVHPPMCFVPLLECWTSCEGSGGGLVSYTPGMEAVSLKWERVLLSADPAPVELGCFHPEHTFSSTLSLFLKPKIWRKHSFDALHLGEHKQRCLPFPHLTDACCHLACGYPCCLPFSCFCVNQTHILRNWTERIHTGIGKKNYSSVHFLITYYI